MKNLAKLLDQPEKLVAKAINQLEDLNGYPSEDARLLAENSQAVRQKITDLGLDPDDTSGEELYQALLVRFDNDSLLIDKALGIGSDGSPEKRMAGAVRLVNKIVHTDDIWVLKHTAAKNLLRQLPPKKLMKQLSYRSTESLLKHENIAEIYTALPYVESAGWQKLLNRAISQLDSTEYELRPPEIVAMPPKRWQSTKYGKALVSSNSLLGSVAVWPAAAKQKPPVLTISLMLLDGLEELTHSQSDGSIASVNPALQWWEQASHLMAACGDEVVSLNYKDIAQDHLKAASYAKRGASKGRAVLWNKLLSRYQNQAGQLEESIASAEVVAGEQLDKLVPKQPVKNLAAEYAEAIANEF